MRSRYSAYVKVGALSSMQPRPHKNTEPEVPGTCPLLRAQGLWKYVVDTTHPLNPLLTDEAAQEGRPTLKDDVIATCDKLGFEARGSPAASGGLCCSGLAVPAPNASAHLHSGVRWLAPPLALGVARPDRAWPRCPPRAPGGRRSSRFCLWSRGATTRRDS